MDVASLRKCSYTAHKSVVAVAANSGENAPTTSLPQRAHTVKISTSIRQLSQQSCSFESPVLLFNVNVSYRKQ